MYTADQSYYLTADGQIVGFGDARATMLIVAAGCQLDDATAARYGLAALPPPVAPTPRPADPATKAVDEPPATKAVRSAPRTQSLRGPQATK